MKALFFTLMCIASLSSKAAPSTQVIPTIPKIAANNKFNDNLNLYYDKNWIVNAGASDKISLWKSSSNRGEIVIKREDNKKYYKFRLSSSNLWSYEKPFYDIKSLDSVEDIEEISILTPGRKVINYKNGYLQSIRSFSDKEILTTTLRTEEKVVYRDKRGRELTFYIDGNNCIKNIQDGERLLAIKNKNDKSCIIKEINVYENNTQIGLEQYLYFSGSNTLKKMSNEQGVYFLRTSKEENVFITDSRLSNKLDTYYNDFIKEYWSNGLISRFDKETKEYSLESNEESYSISKDLYVNLRKTMLINWEFPNKNLSSDTIKNNACVDCVLSKETFFDFLGRKIKKINLYKSGIKEEHVYTYNEFEMKYDTFEETLSLDGKPLPKSTKWKEELTSLLNTKHSPSNLIMGFNDTSAAANPPTYWTTSCNTTPYLECAEKCRKKGGVKTCRTQWVNRLVECRDNNGVVYMCYKTFDLGSLCACWDEDDWDNGTCPVN